MEKPKNVKWTPALDAKLIALWNTGASWDEIAQKIGCTVYAAQSRRKHIKYVDVPKAAPAEQEPVQTSEPTPKQDEIAVMYDLLISITNHARVANFAPDHIVLDCTNGVLLAIASGDDSDGRCVELTLTRHTPVPEAQA